MAFVLKTELAEIITGVKNGEQGDFERLKKKFAPLISKEAFSFNQSGAGEENDLKEEAERALLQAAVSFDETVGVGFGYYAKVCIRNALITLQRAAVSKRRKAEKVRAYKEKRKISFGSFEGLLQEEILSRIDKVLSDYEKEILLLSLDGKKVREIAQIVGKNEKSVSNAIFRIRTKVKKLSELN